MSALRAAALALALVAAMLATAPPASAAPFDNLADLQTALSGCTGSEGSPLEVTLTGSINAPNTRLTIPCHVTLDLNGNDLSTGGITISSGAHLTLTDTSEGTAGTLTADAAATPDLAGIQTAAAGLHIEGGNIIADGGEDAAGIGGGREGDGGNITIIGGTITASAGDDAAGIGGGRAGDGGTITINGGQITATGGPAGAGIGGGYNGDGGNITIAGGDVTAKGGNFAAGIGAGSYQSNGGTIIINGGSINATGGSTHGAGIGGGYESDGGTITINNGQVTATGGSGGAGIGGGAYEGDGGTITINNGQVTATGGGSGAGIGNGYQGDGGTITINNGQVTATGGGGGAGIGGGVAGHGGNITINGGTVDAAGGDDGAGIGGGSSGAGGTINIHDGAITATGRINGTGIGGGRSGAGGTINIHDGAITATGGAYGAGIGGGRSGSGGPVVIGQDAVITASGHSAVGVGILGSVFGSLELAGTLRVPSGVLWVPNSNTTGAEVVITGTGKLLGSEADPTGSFQITGAGQIDNGGVISLAEANVADTVTVLDHHYLVSFDPAGGTPGAGSDPVVVFGPAFDGSYRDLPADPTRAGWAFVGWFTGEGRSGTEITPDATLPGSSSDGVAVPVELFAGWKVPTDQSSEGDDSPATNRVAGPNSVGTGVAASRDLFATHNNPADPRRKAASVVIATTSGFADGLVAAPLAVALNAPLLLTPKHVLDPTVAAEIARVVPPGTTIHLVGGTNALGPDIENLFDDLGYEVLRHSGPNRYATAVAVADAVNAINPATTVLVATGHNHPDALGAGVAAAQTNGVVLLTSHTQPHPATTAWIAAHQGTTTYAIGGPAAAAHPNATPIVGPDRYATLTALADTFFTDPTTIGIARGDQYHDALTGGTHQAHLGGPILATPTHSAHPTTSAWIADNPQITNLWVYGGTAAITTDTINQLLN